MKKLYTWPGTLCVLLLLSGCIPRIEVAAPKEPITINMNVKIEHEIYIKADKEAAQLLEKSDNAVAEEIKNRRE
ncbi:YnbE family lipoprotein [Brenneria izadpanahii]|uniref:YnbE family lipoprotein n=1 Tax=Brenneria izadpanahii TaxID=2722756 RepID=A0ABX7UYR1_9GAMM|nr:YnbE family lipoprotein [Brenneria izadpanahii]QTF10779.1 YnbE family lipoprotein [Brenneria izadpanahii]